MNKNETHINVQLPLQPATAKDFYHFEDGVKVWNYGMRFFVKSYEGVLECYILQHPISVTRKEDIRNAIAQNRCFVLKPTEIDDPAETIKILETRN